MSENFWEKHFGDGGYFASREFGVMFYFIVYKLNAIK